MEPVRSGSFWGFCFGEGLGQPRPSFHEGDWLIVHFIYCRRLASYPVHAPCRRRLANGPAASQRLARWCITTAPAVPIPWRQPCSPDVMLVCRPLAAGLFLKADLSYREISSAPRAAEKQKWPAPESGHTAILEDLVVELVHVGRRLRR